VHSWEFFNEVNITDGWRKTPEAVRDWHKEMSEYLRRIEPQHHLITSSFAGIEDDPLWQLPQMAALLGGWLLGGGYLLHRMFRRQLPRRAAGYGRCVLASLLAGGAAAMTAAGVVLLLQTVAKTQQWPAFTAGLISLLPAAIAGLVLFYLVLYAMFDLPFPQVLRRGTPAAVAVLLLAVAVGLGVVLPARVLVKRVEARRWAEDCLQQVHRAVVAYERDYGRTPASLDALVDDRRIASEYLRNPFSPQREVGYFYHPRPTREEGGDEALLACELRHEHTDEGRAVVFANRGSVARWVTDEQFRRLLDRPANRRFAEVLREAEQKLP
jgi:hypothetical protein